jgi:hypothetical protein
MFNLHPNLSSVFARGRQPQAPVASLFIDHTGIVTSIAPGDLSHDSEKPQCVAAESGILGGRVIT